MSCARADTTDADPCGACQPSCGHPFDICISYESASRAGTHSTYAFPTSRPAVRAPIRHMHFLRVGQPCGHPFDTCISYESASREGADPNCSSTVATAAASRRFCLLHRQVVQRQMNEQTNKRKILKKKQTKETNKQQQHNKNSYMHQMNIQSCHTNAAAHAHPRRSFWLVNSAHRDSAPRSCSCRPSASANSDMHNSHGCQCGMAYRNAARIRKCISRIGRITE